jgi:glycosyltransferase involved in cell wall biosynthesis
LDGLAVVFTGVMDYWPNIEGVLWFADKIVPRIKLAIPGAHFYIVGTRPSAAIRGLHGQNGIVVTGFVDDVRDYLSRASVCIAPLRIARGVQNKVLEAMAMGKPVVCTPEALEGIDAQPGLEILIGADEQSFADAVIGMLRDPVAADRIGRAARRCVERKYSWDENLAVLDRTLETGDAA